ncbi:hypothetical protein ACHAQA_003929 [Verticillium albo-atrum]
MKAPRLGQLLLWTWSLCSNPVVAVDVSAQSEKTLNGRERLNIDDSWRFWRSEFNPDGIIYDHRPDLDVDNAVVLKPWILPSGNDFIADSASHHKRPEGQPSGNLSYNRVEFDDGGWEVVNLPHDWAVKGPFYTEDDPIIGGGMGRLPVHGVGWYRRQLSIEADDRGKHIFLDIDGAMSYAMVWLNGNLVGGWPYGYNSFRLDLTPYLEPGDENLLAIRLDNPPDSARWYSGGGIYRSVWLTKVEPVHVGQWGTYIVSKDVSDTTATLELTVQLQNSGGKSQKVEVGTEVFETVSGNKKGKRVSEFPRKKVKVSKGDKTSFKTSTRVKNPKLWGPKPTQHPNLYVAITTVYLGGKPIDKYETRFGIRTFVAHPDKGLLVNGEKIHLNGVNQHHDLGALGAAFNVRAAERQLEILQELGVNAIRMAHNPPATELLDLADRMGFLVMDEIFDSWYRNKTASDFHLIFEDWHEADLRSFLRRDRNHASIFSWSFGNEVGEQHDDEAGAVVARRLHDIVRNEDPTRPSTASMNYASPEMPFGHAMDMISINYQGSGIRDTPNYDYLQGIHREPSYPAFHQAFPDKMIVGSETASALSVRGKYTFPVEASDLGSPVNETTGGNATEGFVSDYGLYTANFGSPPDKVWLHEDENPFVAGDFVWTGFDYIGEPTPYYAFRSSYCGIVDLAGFKKDRAYQYQSRWKPDLPMAHILPHWNWPDRVGKVTPVHVFSAADEAELFVNGDSQGRKKRDAQQYRFRWDDVVYEPGNVSVTAYKDGKLWVEETIRTTGSPAALKLGVDRTSITGDGIDLAFITVEVVDEDGSVVPDADSLISFSVSGPGEIVATDNGNPADLVEFPLAERNALSGLALAIVRAEKGGSGDMKFTADADGLTGAELIITVE